MSLEEVKKKVGAPEFEPTTEERDTVRMMVAMGITQADIARTIREKGIDVKTLNKHFSTQIETAKALANAKVGGAMFEKAIGGDVQAQKYWLGCKAGWKETSVSETTGDLTSRVEINFVPSDQK
tara:strand:- start:12 stop:383 length:372 start_codon:yes stop_codon:yes gene_type:complete